MGKTLLEIQGLKKSYGRKAGETKALNGVSFQVLEGEFLGIMGSSGSGKTTLLNCIATMLKPTEGKVLLAGEDISTFKGKKLAQFRGQEIGYLFQDFELLDNLTVEENILLPSAIHGDDQKQAERKCMELAKYLDMQEVLDKFPSQISGGQKQRTAVARALMNHPDLILADEPTGNLDSRSGAAVIGAFREAKEKLDATIFMVTHDSFSASHCDRVLLMRDGQVQKELKRQGSRREFMDILLDELKQLNERM